MRQYALLAWKKKIYPGGVCWLQGQEKSLGQKIVNFAKSKLGLQPLEDRDLQSQINYCWSNWPEGDLEGDVLIVLDDVSDYQYVKSYLPPREQRFKLLITTPQHSLEQSFLDEDFEYLCLDYTTSELSKRLSDNSDRDDFPYVLLMATILITICSGLSLCFSYIQYGSEPWLVSFKDYGWVIEFIRSLILIITEFYIVFIVFQQEFYEFFGFKKINPEDKEYRKARRFIRVIMLTITVAIIVIVPYYHLEYAPQKLADFWKQWTVEHPETQYIELDGEDGFVAYRLPYLCYLPYSLINYIVIWLPIVSVSIYAAIKDCICLKSYKKKLMHEQIKIERFKEQYKASFFDQKNICEKVENDFQGFSQSFVRQIGNYVAVFLGIIISVAFEVTFGSKSLAETAIYWLGLGYFVCAVALLIILLAYRFYEASLQNSSSLLLNNQCENLKKFKCENSVPMFIKGVFNTYFNLYLGIIFATILLIWHLIN